MGDIPETERFINCINIPNRQTEKLNEQLERNRVLEEENKKLKELIKQKDQEITELTEVQASLEEWMKKQMEEVRKSTDKLNEKTMGVYNRVLEKYAAKSKASTSAERKKLTEEIQKMEDICEDISKDIIKSNEEAIQKITQFGVDSERRCLSETKEITKTFPEKAEDQKSDSELAQQKVYNKRWTEENHRIKRFLGKWIGRYVNGSIEIGMDDTTGLYYCHYYYHHVKPSRIFYGHGDLWLPDGVWRKGIQSTLEGYLLTITNTRYCEIKRSYELCQYGLICDGLSYTRAK